MVKIVLEKVNKIFPPDVHVLKDIELEIHDKEFMVLVGPSGCGKSTTLNIIAGLERVSTGAVKFGDVDVSELTPKERNVAMVFQSYALYPHMNVRKNMSFALRLAKVDQAFIDEQVENAAKMLGISYLLDRKPKELSGGQRQRVALGRCIVRNPTVFLFDEPLSNLDAKLRTQMRAEVIKLQKKLKTTLVYVTHDQVEAMSMADRISILHKGVIQQVGTPDKVYNQPLNKFVGGFIGAPTMNFLDVEYKNEALHFGENKIEISNELQIKLKQRSNDSLILGIRPEAFQITKDKQKNSFKVEVSVVEYLGKESLVSFEFKGEISAKALSGGHYRAEMGDEGYITVEEQDLHIFDSKTEINLVHYPENE